MVGVVVVVVAMVKVVVEESLEQYREIAPYNSHVAKFF